MIRQIDKSIGVENISHIVHIGDIHIRNFKRHAEYREVFSDLYSQLRDIVKERPNTIIVVAGDVVHLKTDISPELVQMTYEFLRTLSEITGTIVIPGNHDTNLSNSNRLDTLSPIISTIENGKIVYLKDSGWYKIGGVNFIHNSIFSSEFIRRSDLPNLINGRTVSLYHGIISGIVTDLGFELSGDYAVEDFSGYDITILGDIHKQQYLDSKKTIAYCGSLIQQDFSEDVDNHGFLLWDLERRKSKFFTVKNNWGFYNIRVTNDVIEEMPSEFKKNPLVKLIVSNSSNYGLNKAIEHIRETTNITELTVQKTTVDVELESGFKISDMFYEIRNPEIQNRLISEYLRTNYSVSPEILDQIEDINIELNSQISEEEILRNTEWTPVKFTWSNMFSYEEGNSFEFSDKVGLYGIVAKNASGKSNLLDSILFCLFDKCSRAFMAADIMNTHKDNFECQLEFRIHGESYWIKRSATKDKKEKVKVKVDFWKEDGSGGVKSLNGKDRSETNEIIRMYIGEFNDFVLTSFSTQAAHSSFIEMGQTDRKDRLSQFMDLDIFEKLYELASNSQKEVQGIIKEYSKIDYSLEMGSIKSDIEVHDSEIAKLQSSIVEKRDNISKIHSDIERFSSKIHKVPADIESVTNLQVKLDKCVQKIKELRNNKDVLNNKTLMLNETLSDIESKYDKERVLKLKSDNDTRERLKKEIQTLSNELRVKKVKMDALNQKIDHLKEHEYDENCQYCVKNIFVVDAKKAEAELKELKPEYDLMVSKQDKLETEFNLYKDTSLEWDSYQIDRELYNKTKLKSSEDALSMEKINSDIEKSISLQESIESKIKQSEEWSIQLQENQTVETQIQNCKLGLKSEESSLDYLNDLLSKEVSMRSIKDSKLNEFQEKFIALHMYEESFKAYDYYMKAVDTNGVPYSLISKALPQIETEVNSILSQMVNFSVVFQTDGKNINCYIAYGNDRFWKIELCSGMERFVTSLAIRIALLSVSSLPRPNFIVIDEGMGVFDAENLGNFGTIFQYMKSQFDLVLVITHIDGIKDYFDKQITIAKENGYSRLTV